MKYVLGHRPSGLPGTPGLSVGVLRAVVSAGNRDDRCDPVTASRPAVSEQHKQTWFAAGLVSATLDIAGTVWKLVVSAVKHSSHCAVVPSPE